MADGTKDIDITGAKTPACSLVTRRYNEEEHIGRLLSGVNKYTRQF